MTPDRAAALAHVRFSLLFKRRWAYLRYRHAREAMRLAGPVASVLVVGCGAALAEVALAIEFPDTAFRLTDHAGATHNRDGARKLIDRFGLRNIAFGELDILQPAAEARHDLIYSVEVLEHIRDDDRAAANMRALARRFVFCLVPFADRETNANPARRARLLEVHGHHVAGYDPERLRRLFPDPVATRGAYWADAGRLLRDRLTDMDAEAMRAAAADLYALAEADLRPDVPARTRDAAGVWTLARTGG